MNEIVVALSLGAAALAKGVLGEVGKEAYQALKNAVLRIVAPSDVEKLEQKPDSGNRQGVIAEELADKGRAEDPDLARLARELIAALKSSAAGGATGVSLEEIEAVNLRLQRIEATGTGVSAKKLKLTGDIEVNDVSAGVLSPGNSPRR